MPAFMMFEKIAPATRVPAAPVNKEPRGVIVQMLDRLAETRLQRALRRIERDPGCTEGDVTPERTRSA